MQRFLHTARLAVIFAVTAIILIIYGAKLYALQVYDDGTPEELVGASVRYETIPAARGDILDRNGVPLVSGTVKYNILLSRDDLLAVEDTNAEILKYVYTAVENGVKYTDTLPITNAAPFNYVADMSDAQSWILSEYLKAFELPEDISASDLIAWFKEHYGLDYSTSLSEARLIIGIRYELETRVFVNIDPYVFVEDADSEFISVLYERGYRGFSVETRTERKYYTSVAAHILGYIGAMDADQYEYYKKLDYPMNAEVGQSGMEAAFEEYLHGQDGRVRLTVGKNGAVLNSETITEAKPGCNVYSSLDKNLQECAEKALNDKITEINATRDAGDKADGGAVVVVQVGTGETLALATYPSYNIETYFEDYTKLAADSTAPLLNRATMGIYNPGSTFKPVVGYAGLCTGTITEYSTVYDGGQYMAYDDYQPYCWIYGSTGGGHGTLDLAGALENSCNVFFWWVGDNVGVEAIASAAKEFGLGEETGLEVGEYIGYRPSIEKKKELMGPDEPWYAADTLLAAIGQGFNMYTPAQLASYCSTIATGGTRYKMTLMHTVKNADYTEVIAQSEKKVLNTLKHPENVAVLQRGMEAVAYTGTAFGEFDNIPVRVACKTGTVQSDNAVSNTGVFICYAPAEAPEIAISVVVEKGTSGVTVLEVARDVLVEYFSRTTGEVELVFENELSM